MHGAVPAFAAGVSWGASPALNATQKMPAEWAGTVLLNPAFITMRDRDFRRGLLGHLWPWHWFSPIALPLAPGDYTDSEQTVARYLRPAQLKHTATFSFLWRTNAARKQAVAALSAPAKPLLILLGERDPLVRLQDFQRMIVPKLQRDADTTVLKVPGATHAAILEAEREKFAAIIVRWIHQHRPGSF
jgi:alpha-beta hydrolase superfamily lysophospholipase